jgi:hypothetical protein
MKRSVCSFLTILLVLLFTVSTVYAASTKKGKSDKQAGRRGALIDLDSQNGYGSLHFGDAVPAGMVYQSTVLDPAGKIELYAWPSDDGKFGDVILGTAYYCFRDAHLVSVHFFAPADQNNAKALMKALRTKFGPSAPLSTQPNAFQWQGRRVLLTVGLGETPIFVEFRSVSDVARIVKSLERGSR